MATSQENQAFIDQALESKEFTDLIDEAAPYRVKIDTDYRREMKEVRDMFMDQKIKSDSKLKEIVAKSKKNRTPEEIEYANSAAKKANKEFNAVKRIIHPNKGSSEEAAQKLVERVVEVAKLLKYIGRTDIEDAFAAAGISITIPSLEDENPYFAQEGKPEIMADIFNQVDEVQGQICQAADKVKIDLYNELPENVRFDAKMNKKGIRASQFVKLAKTKAVALEKSMEQFDKFKESQIKKNENELIAKQIEAEKIKEI